METIDGFTPGNTRGNPAHETVLDVNVADTQLTQVQMMHLNMNQQNVTVAAMPMDVNTSQPVYSDVQRWHIPLNTNLIGIPDVQSVQPATSGNSDF